MTEVLKKNWSLIIVAVIAITLAFINIPFDKHIIGLDNASPYFGVENYIHRIAGANTPIYGGLVFVFPGVFLGELIGWSAAFMSGLYLFGAFVIGVLGMASLIKYVQNKVFSRDFLKNPEYRKNIRYYKNLSTLLTTLFYMASMFTFWIFGHPNFLFLAAYGAIPWLIFFLLKEFGSKKDSLVKIILIGVASLVFLITSLNLVAFTLYLGQILVLLVVINLNSKKKFNLPLTSSWAFGVLATLLITLQIVSLVNGSNQFVLTNIYEYFKGLTTNPVVATISEDIILSEKTNTLINTARFAGGWMELHNVNNEPVFQYYDLYKNNIFKIIAGLVPFFLSLIPIPFIFQRGSKLKNLRPLVLLEILGLFLTSMYFIIVIEPVPYISDGLRWASSKLWPIYIIPLFLMASVGITLVHLYFNQAVKNSIFTVILALSILFTAFPVLSGNLLSPSVKVNVPAEYLSELGKFGSSDKVLILPPPQKLYFRAYTWGYYGSDFQSYITPAQIVDRANLYQYGNTYDKYLEQLGKCELDNDINYVLYDSSVSSKDKNLDLYLNCLNSLEFKFITGNQHFAIYENR